MFGSDYSNPSVIGWIGGARSSSSGPYCALTNGAVWVRQCRSSRSPFLFRVLNQETRPGKADSNTDSPKYAAHRIPVAMPTFRYQSDVNECIGDLSFVVYRLGSLPKGTFRSVTHQACSYRPACDLARSGIPRHPGAPSSHWLSVSCSTPVPSKRITKISPYG